MTSLGILVSRSIRSVLMLSLIAVAFATPVHGQSTVAAQDVQLWNLPIASVGQRFPSMTIAPTGTPSLILTGGRGFTKVNLQTGSVLFTDGNSNLDSRSVVWVSPANPRDLVVSGYEDRHAYWSDGAHAWTWSGLGCCNVFHTPFAIDLSNGTGITQVNWGGPVRNLSNGSFYSNVFGAGDFTGYISIASPTMAYSAGNEGLVTQFHPGSTGVNWSFRVSTTQPLREGAIAADGSFVVTTGSSHFGLGPVWPFAPGELARVRPDGTLAWKVPANAHTAPVIGNQGLIFVGAQATTSSVGAIQAYDVNSGTLVWSANVDAGFVPSDLLLGNDGLVYAAAGDIPIGGGGNGRLYAFDQASGTRQLTVTNVPGAFEIILFNGVIFVSGQSITAIPVSATGYDAQSPWPVRFHDNQRTGNGTAPVNQGASAAAAAPDKLIGWWRADLNGLDSSPFGNHGVLEASAAFSSGSVGAGAFSFNGQRGQFRVAQPANRLFDVGDQFTLSFWYRIPNLNDFNLCCFGLVTTDFYLVEIGHGGISFVVSMDSGQSWHFADPAPRLADSNWHHIAATYDGSGGGMKLYIDGALTVTNPSVTGSLSPMRPGSYLSIGSEDGRTTCPECIGTRYANAGIDEVKLFARALSDTEILREAGLDDDGDEVMNDDDNCPQQANPDQFDTDSDGFGDACDADTDNDGLLNSLDNCSLIANPDQTNTDADQFGDACDADLDGDGVENSTDNCSSIANPDQADTNGNGVGNACEPNSPPFANPGPDQVVAATFGGGASVTLDGSASTDPEGDALTFTWSGIPIFGVLSGSTVTLNFPIGEFQVLLEVRDVHGNSSTATATVRVVDTPPVIGDAARLVFEASTSSGAFVDLQVEAYDAVDEVRAPADCYSGLPTAEFRMPRVLPLGISTVDCIASDSAGNIASRKFSVSVVDTTAPIIGSRDPGLRFEAISPSGAFVSLLLEATDAVDGAVAVMCTADPDGAGGIPPSLLPLQLPLGSHAVVCRATDARGNFVEEVFTVSVVDTMAPMILFNSPTTDSLFEVGMEATVVFAIVSDSVGVASITVNGVSALLQSGTPQNGRWSANAVPVPSIVPGEPIQFEYVASDFAGNTRTSILVIDNDGIPSAIDRNRATTADESSIYSNEFTLSRVAGHPWPTTAGTVLTRNNWKLSIGSFGPQFTSATITQQSTPPTGPASISLCPGDRMHLLLDAHGESAGFYCSGTTLTLTAMDAYPTLVLFKALANGKVLRITLKQGSTVSTGSPVVAAADNPDPVLVELLDENQQPFGRFELAAGNAVDVQVTTDPVTGEDKIELTGLSGEVEVTISGQTTMVREGQESSLLRDTTPPEVRMGPPADDATYLLNQFVPAAYLCSDAVSGIASCQGTLPNGAPLDTATVGSKTLEVRAFDLAGNGASRSTRYQVSYGICLLYDPSKSVKNGATVPLKIQLCDADGRNVSASQTIVQASALRQVNSQASETLLDSGNANPEYNFRFDGSLGEAGGYIFNLSTKGLNTGTYELSVTVSGDRTIHKLLFQVR